MSSYPRPVNVGQFDPVKAGDVVDLYLDIAADLISGEAVSSCALTVTDSAGAVVAGVVGTHTEAAGRTDFRLTAPAAGVYQLTAVFSVDDGQQFTRVAGLVAV
jgi:hypothetical protein